MPLYTLLRHLWKVHLQNSDARCNSDTLPLTTKPHTDTVHTTPQNTPPTMPHTPIDSTSPHHKAHCTIPQSPHLAQHHKPLHTTVHTTPVHRPEHTTHHAHKPCFLCLSVGSQLILKSKHCNKTIVFRWNNYSGTCCWRLLPHVLVAVAVDSTTQVVANQPSTSQEVYRLVIFRIKIDRLWRISQPGWWQVSSHLGRHRLAGRSSGSTPCRRVAPWTLLGVWQFSKIGAKMNWTVMICFLFFWYGWHVSLTYSSAR